jgi:hypothetical protein
MYCMYTPGGSVPYISLTLRMEDSRVMCSPTLPPDSNSYDVSRCFQAIKVTLHPVLQISKTFADTEFARWLLVLNSSGQVFSTSSLQCLPM